MKHSAAVVGSGPNGLSAAIVLAQAGLDVEVFEAAPTIGGGARCGEVTLPGFVHDLGSAVYPMALSSPFFRSLPLQKYGLRWIHSPAQLAHPLDDGTAVTLERDVRATAEQLGADGPAYVKLFEPLVDHWRTLIGEVLRPLTVPRHPLLLAKFGLRAGQPAKLLLDTLFRGHRAKALCAGSCAHSCLKLSALLSAAFGMMLGGAAHAVGWPIPEGGSQKISDALAEHLRALGGRITTNFPVRKLEDIGEHRLTLCDVTPRQFLAMAAHKLRPSFQNLLRHYRYGPGIYKVDWALREPIPWKAQECRRAITVHVGGTLEEIAVSEAAAWDGRHPEKPFVLVVQPSLFDRSRAPRGKHTAWAYCHVPNGWSGSALAQIESQMERFAPGFRECVLATSARSAPEMQSWDENLVGGDVNGGSLGLGQFAFRPTWRRYGTPIRDVYLCSSSTPPGGAVHGMCGFWAAQRALRSLKVL